MTNLLTQIRGRWAQLRGREAAGGYVPSEKERRLRRLEQWQNGETQLTDADIHFWGARFQRRAIQARAGCSFERYLLRPNYYERIARARRIIAQKTSQSHEHNQHDQSGRPSGSIEGPHVPGRGA